MHHWHESCLSNIIADRELVATRLHMTVATQQPNFAHAVHCDPFAQTKRFVAAKEIIVDADRVADFKRDVFTARTEVDNLWPTLAACLIPMLLMPHSSTTSMTQ